MNSQGNNGKAPEEFRQSWTQDERETLDLLWAGLDDSLPEPPSARMRRKLQRLIWSERIKTWNSRLSLAGMATALVVGLILGKVFFAVEPVSMQPSNDLRLEASLLSGATVSAHLAAILNMREAEQLPPHAVDSLVGLLGSERVSVGVQMAALEALMAHADQAPVQQVISSMLETVPVNPMIQTQLLEFVSPSAETEDGAQL